MNNINALLTLKFSRKKWAFIYSKFTGDDTGMCSYYGNINSGNSYFGLIYLHNEQIIYLVCKGEMVLLSKIQIGKLNQRLVETMKLVAADGKGRETPRF